MGCFIPLNLMWGRRNPAVTSRCGSLLLSLSADACFATDDVIAFEGQVRLVGLSLTDTHMHSDAATTIPSRPSVGLAAAASFADVSMSHEAAAARPANHATMHQGSHLFKCLSDDGVAYVENSERCFRTENLLERTLK